MTLFTSVWRKKVRGVYKVNYYYSNIKSFFHNDNPKETVGIIGYLRGDFASSGEEFHTTWFDVHEELKTLNFKTEIDDVINELRKGILKDRSSMKKVFSNHPNCVMNSEAGISRGVFVETEHYEYAFRLIGDKGNYDFYCYCADKNVQPPHLRNARRFRDENGQLAKTIEEVSKLTQAEALNYYTDGDRYESGGNIYTFRKSGMHMSFVSETGGETEVHPDKLGTFLPDVEYLGMSYDDIAFAKSIGWLNGYADGSFRGDNNITRAEAVTVVNHATLRVPDKEYIDKNESTLNKFTDLKNNAHWGYYSIIELANTHKAVVSSESERWVK